MAQSPTYEFLQTASAETLKIKKKILHDIGRAIADFSLIRENDRLMVCVSGGKDSLAMLHLLLDLQKRAPVKFDLFAFTLDQGQPGFDASILRAFYESLGIEYYIDYEDTYSIVIDKIQPGKTYCSLCSRLRRGILYTTADRYRATAIALGHHAMDAAETLLLNLFYNGRMASMPPLLISDDQQHRVIRPLIYADEPDLERYATLQKFPVIPCNLCNNQENLQRQRIKGLLESEIEKNSAVRYSLKKALRNVQPRHLWDNRLSTSDQIEKEDPLQGIF